MKKQIVTLITFGIVSFATIAFSAQVFTVTATNGNVRTGPSTKYPVSIELTKGYILKKVKKQGEWLKVKDFENDTGWVHESIVKPSKKVIVNSKSNINMRSQPTKKGTKIGDVERGVVFTKLDTKGNWTKVQHDTGLTGWIYSPLLWP